ncbi:MAG TPA: hypothetical protein PKH37_10020 [Alphaproteobacteria bacterium]|nr:hypothetical protein [Alphaproteobacteria bacterium]
MASTKPPLLTGFERPYDSVGWTGNRIKLGLSRFPAQSHLHVIHGVPWARHRCSNRKLYFSSPVRGGIFSFPPQKILNETPIGLWFGMMPLLTSWEIVRVCCYKDVAPNGAVLRLARGAHHLVTE